MRFILKIRKRKISDKFDEIVKKVNLFPMIYHTFILMKNSFLFGNISGKKKQKSQKFKLL